MRSPPAAPDYQALVCVFLLGGNDGHNTVIPITTAQQNYSLYQQNRGGLALPQASLLPIANGSDTYGLHPSLVEIQGLYNQGKAAVLANVGMLVQPITRAVYLTNNSAHRALGAVLALRSEQPVADRDSHRHRQHRLGRPHHGSDAGAERRRDLPAHDRDHRLRLVLHRRSRPFRPPCLRRPVTAPPAWLR